MTICVTNEQVDAICNSLLFSVVVVSENQKCRVTREIIMMTFDNVFGKMLGLYVRRRPCIGSLIITTIVMSFAEVAGIVGDILSNSFVSPESFRSSVG